MSSTSFISLQGQEDYIAMPGAIRVASFHRAPTVEIIFTCLAMINSRSRAISRDVVLI